MRSQLLFGAIGLALCSSSIAQADLNATVERVCKPVVPQIILSFSPGDLLDEEYSVLMRYDQQGSLPYSRDTFSRRGIRNGFCEPSSGRCTSSRMRYEVRTEEHGYQSIQIRAPRKDQPGSPILGGVRWTGPAFPDRVLISCDLDDPDPQTACTLTGVEHSANPLTSGSDGGRSRVERHDQCEPETAGSGMSFT